MTKSITVALVGASPTGADNLALSYLAGALLAREHAPEVISFRGIGDFDAAARRAVGIAPGLIGVSAPSGEAAVEALAFVYRLRDLGYTGHVTMGGTFATLARRRLLALHPGVDSVVRHDGELPLAALADALGAGGDLERLPGVSTRRGDGLPAPVGDRDHLDISPYRTAFKRYAGVKSAKVSAVRGCFGRCRYCGLRALREAARQEGRACGLDAAAMERLGVGGIRRRPVAAVADEMADLYARDVRFFHFVDENHLPRDPLAAAGVIDSLDRALTRRGVGPRAVNMMLRADVATPEVVDALHRLGLARCLLGVESMKTGGLRRLGRGGAPALNLRAMEALRARGIVFHFNLLLIDPDSTMGRIDAEIEALGQVRGGLIDPFQVEVYYGTDLYHRLQRERRLEGGPLLFHYWPADAGARRFARIFYRLRRDASEFLHMTTYAYEVLGAYAVAGRLGMLKGRRPIGREVERRIDEHNRLWIALLETASELAGRGASTDEVENLVAESTLRSAHLILGFERLKERIEAASSGPLRTEIFYPRTAAAVALALSVIAASGCSRTVPVGGPGPVRIAGAPATDNTTVTDRDVDTGTSIAQETGPAPEDAAPNGEAPAGSGTEAETERKPVIGAMRAGTYGCFTEHTRKKIEKRALRLGCPRPPKEAEEYGFVLDLDGNVLDMVMRSGVSVDEEIKKCFLAAVKGQRFPCMKDRDIRLVPPILLA